MYSPFSHVTSTSAVSAFSPSPKCTVTIFGRSFLRSSNVVPSSTVTFSGFSTDITSFVSTGGVTSFFVTSTSISAFRFFVFVTFSGSFPSVPLNVYVFSASPLYSPFSHVTSTSAVSAFSPSPKCTVTVFGRSFLRSSNVVPSSTVTFSGLSIDVTSFVSTGGVTLSFSNFAVSA